MGLWSAGACQSGTCACVVILFGGILLSNCSAKVVPALVLESCGCDFLLTCVFPSHASLNRAFVSYLAGDLQEHDTKHTVFVGGLPFDIETEAVWEHFSQCGDVVNVRVVRDKKTNFGKGIAYVRFKV